MHARPLFVVPRSRTSVQKIFLFLPPSLPAPAHKTSLVVQKLRHQVLLFAEADRDRSGGERDPSLSFDEWCMLLRRPPNATEPPASASPSYRRTHDDLKRWFEVADLGGAGRVTLYDFVMLIFRGEFARAGDLGHLYRRWDRKGSGSINAMEWGRAADELGFARFAAPLWERRRGEGHARSDVRRARHAAPTPAPTRAQGGHRGVDPHAAPERDARRGPKAAEPPRAGRIKGRCPSVAMKP